MLTGEKLKFLRQMQNLTQQQIADYVGITRNYISMMENREREVTQELHDKWLEGIYKLGAMSAAEQKEYLQSLKNEIDDSEKEIKSNKNKRGKGGK